MQIIHRISLWSSPKIRRELAGMDVVIADEGLLTFEFSESHVAWPRLERWVADNHALDIVSTRFSKSEIEDAEWLSLNASSHHGYPQPEDTYKEATYDPSHYCMKCGTGRRQIAPYRMRGEPKFGRSGILQLNWVFDQFFVPPPLWRDVFEPHGIGCRQVLNSKGRELETVVQLDIREEVDVDTACCGNEACCPTCNRVKYLPHVRGYFPRMLSAPTGHMVKSRQEFGSGPSAHSRLLISRQLFRAMSARKLRGFEVDPVAAAGST
jgi:hypothetical protein